MPHAWTTGKEGLRVRDAAANLGVPLSPEAEAALLSWLGLLLTWNARVDLTAARTPDELVDLMVADALVLSTRLPTGATVVDVGTGAGAPGLALAFLRPDLAVTLCEPLAKRAAFLRTVLGTLAPPRVELVARKGEDLVATWQVALARATLPPRAWLDLASRLVDPDADAWLFLAKEAEPSDPRFAMAEAVPYAWPLTGASRRLVRYRRVRPSGP